MIRTIGPVKSAYDGGSKWCSQGITKISRIFISYSSQGIRSIEIAHVVDKSSVVLSERYGSAVTDGIVEDINFDVVKLNYPSEHITCIQGTRNSECISSLTFGTNVRSYGPFGKEDGFTFKFNVGDDFYGFFGCSGTMLTEIGVYIKINEKINSEEIGVPEVSKIKEMDF